MPDQYQELRQIPLLQVLAGLGVDTSAFKSRKGGQEHGGPCPVCRPKKNRGNFSVHQDGRFRCFSCEAKGRGGIDLAMLVRNIGFQEAVDWLKTIELVSQARRSVIRLVQTPAAGMPTENAPFKGSYEKFFRPHEWLTARGLSAETLARYEVGFYQNDSRRSPYNGSVMLKIRRWSDGECVGYLSRNIGEVTPDKPKYRFPAVLQKNLELFGAWQLKQDGNLPLRILFLVESPLCVMRFHQLGFPAVSPFGWSVSEAQAEIIDQLAKGVVFCPDRDKHKEALQSAGLLSQFVWVRTPELPANDPEHLSLDQIKALA
jgi:DNA primase